MSQRKRKQINIEEKSRIISKLESGISNKDLAKEYVGCALLPFVWAVNAVWFYKEAFEKPPFEEQKEIKRYVIKSSIGAVVWAIVLVIWIIVFQLNRESWGAVGDSLSFVVPMGRP